MGTATTLVHVLPNYQSIDIAAPLILIALRLLQGLAIGGECGGAAIYVAEHAPPEERGRLQLAESPVFQRIVRGRARERPSGTLSATAAT